MSRGSDQDNTTMPSLMEQIATEIVGPMLIGTVLNFTLYGVLCVQVHTYYMSLPHDQTFLKIIVYGCFIIETCQTLLIGVDGYNLLATHMGDLLSLDQTRSYWLSLAVFGGVVSTTGQLLYSYRIWMIFRSRIILLLVIILSLCAGATQIAGGVLVCLSGRISSEFSDVYLVSLIYFSANTLCDILITGLIVYQLTCRHSISNARLRHQIKHLVKLIVETGGFIAITNIVCFILYLFYENTTYFAVPYMMSSKLYSNTLILILNNRVVVPGSRNDINTDNFSTLLWGLNTIPPSQMHSASHSEDSGSNPTSTNLAVLGNRINLGLQTSSQTTVSKAQSHDMNTC